MKLELIRTYHPLGTNGILMQDDLALCHTIELPWKNNLPKISCIPEGEYELVKRYSPKFKWHLQLKNVLKRDLILIHPANNAMMELEGCIAPVSIITGQGMGLQSRVVFNKLIALVYKAFDEHEPVFLIIKKCTNEKPK